MRTLVDYYNVGIVCMYIDHQEIVAFCLVIQCNIFRGPPCFQHSLS